MTPVAITVEPISRRSTLSVRDVAYEVGSPAPDAAPLPRSQYPPAVTATTTTIPVQIFFAII
jgi:hypothetical protein